MRPFTAPPHEVFILPAEIKHFSPFPKLPRELRNMIWLEALSHERLIKVDLGGSWDDGRYVGPCRITLQGPRDTNAPILNPLLLTCSESRKIAMTFYRIQFSWECGEDGITKLYLCPELDILEIWWERVNSLVEFATDCFNRDRDRKGLLNLVLPHEGTFGLNRFPIDKEAAKAAVYRLQRVILEGRVLGTVSSERHLLIHTDSVPTACPTTTLDHFTIDPRGIDKLAILGLHCDGLSQAKNRWQSFLDMVEIDQSKCCFQQSVMLSRSGRRARLKESRCFLPFLNGFWMVPMEAMHASDGDWTSDYVDLRDYPPQLYVSQPSPLDR